MQRLLIVLLIFGLGSSLGQGVQLFFGEVALRLGVDTQFVVGVALFWCLAFLAPFLFFRLRKRASDD
jgi:ABC-type uncharacterized transport system permease subunit